MAEYTANAVQTVQANRNILFTDTPAYAIPFFKPHK